MLKAIGYVRRSKLSKAKTVSLQEQEARIRSYCQSHDMELVEIVSHDGISGTKRSRFDAIEDAFKRCSVCNVLVVYNLDRLARDVSGLMDYIRSLASRGIIIHETASGLINTKSSSGFILTAVKGAFDELFPLLIGEKTRDALQNKKEQGQRYSRIPPFGYRYENGWLIENIEEQKALQVLSQCRDRGYGARKALKILHNGNYSGRSSLGLIHKILKSFSYSKDSLNT